MYRYNSSQSVAVIALFSSLAAATALVGWATAAPTDIVDLEGDSHNNPPASTTDTSPRPPASTNVETESPTGKSSAPREERERQKTDAAKLKVRAGEKIEGDARGKAQVLGMALQEGTKKRVKVVDVAMNSPAFDAGVMKGDEILSYQGFRGDDYRKWIDGMQRLTSDTAAGLAIPVVLDRDGKQVAVKIRVPEKPVRPSTTRPLAQPGSPIVTQEIAPALPAPGAPVAVASGGGNVVIDNAGPFNDFFGGGQASPNERAVAQIFRIGGQPSPNPAGTTSGNNTTVGATAAPVNGGAKIGMAGFRDDPSGMVVMVDVGALPPGNYTVGISDPSVIGGAAVTGAGAANPNVQSPSQLAPPRAPAPATPNGATPAPAGAGQPQGNLPPRSASIPRTILAQVSAAGETENALTNSAATDSIPPTGQATPSTTPATGEAVPSTTPATGNVNPSTSTPTGRSSVNDAQQAELAKQAAAAGRGAGNTTMNRIGTITVDQSGTGRMQQKVEGMQVRNVVGQAIVLYSQDGSSPKTFPANPNVASDSTLAKGVAEANARNGSVPPPNAAASATQVPVAAGIIQLVTDRRPPVNGQPATSQSPAGTKASGEQPAVATPATDPNLVR